MHLKSETREIGKRFSFKLYDQQNYSRKPRVRLHGSLSVLPKKKGNIFSSELLLHENHNLVLIGDVVLNRSLAIYF